MTPPLEPRKGRPSAFLASMIAMGGMQFESPKCVICRVSKRRGDKETCDSICEKILNNRKVKA